MNRLDPPHIQLGFYWHARDQVESFRSLLHWLLMQGYQMRSEVVAFRAVRGNLPLFSQIHLGAIEGVESSVCADWTVDRALSESEWLPVHVRMVPKTRRDVEIELGYARMAEACLDDRAHHAIEVVASGADLDLLENVPASQVAASVVANARRTARWQRAFFELACQECQPDYAGSFMEWELQPPSEIARSKDMSNFDGLYLPKALADTTKVAIRLAALPSWSTQPLCGGITVHCTARETNEAERGMAILRDAFEKAFGAST